MLTSVLDIVDVEGRIVRTVRGELFYLGVKLGSSCDEKTAEVTALGKPVAAGGSGTCHLAIAPGARHLLIANYLSGTVAAVAPAHR